MNETRKKIKRKLMGRILNLLCDLFYIAVNIFVIGFFTASALYYFIKAHMMLHTTAWVTSMCNDRLMLSHSATLYSLLFLGSFCGVAAVVLMALFLNTVKESE